MGRVLKITASRPWTAGCVVNLWFDIQDGKPVWYTAMMTSRTIYEVFVMRWILKTYGFEVVYKAINYFYSKQKRIPETIKSIMHMLTARGLVWHEDDKANAQGKSCRRKVV